MAQNQTHGLVHNGTAHDDIGYELTDPKDTSGEGRAKCKCGWLSETLADGKTRREAYKRHLAEPAIDTDDPEPTDEDLIGDAPAEPKTTTAKGKAATAVAPAKGKAATKKAEPKQERGLVATTGPYEDVVFDVTPTWLWVDLGPHAAEALSGAVKGITASVDNSTRTVRFAGASKTRVAALANLLRAVWATQSTARKSWKKADKKYVDLVSKKGDGWRVQAGIDEHAFTKAYVDGVAALLAKGTPAKGYGGDEAKAADLSAALKAAQR